MLCKLAHLKKRDTHQNMLVFDGNIGQRKNGYFKELSSALASGHGNMLSEKNKHHWLGQ